MSQHHEIHGPARGTIYAHFMLLYRNTVQQILHEPGVLKKWTTYVYSSWTFEF
jgi:hypothetical protein